MFDWFSALTSEDNSLNNLSIEEKEEEFNNVVRENIIALLTFITLYVIAYCIIVFLHRKRERDGWYGGEEDAKVYRISLYLCAVTLAVSVSAVLMLPMSMIGNEIVHLFPGSYWVQWLNGALIHNMWNWTYTLSNISIFILLPFSYFFTESEGFSGQRRGLLPRVHETVIVLMLLAVLVFGLAVLALAFFYKDNSYLDLLKLVGEYYMQYLYSFLLGCFVILMLTCCAPVGFILLFNGVGKLLVKPKLFEKSEELITATKIQEDSLNRKLRERYGLTVRKNREEREDLQNQVNELQRKRKELERRHNSSFWERNLGYPVVMLLLILLTGLALFLVSIHIIELVFIGDEELHSNTDKTSFHKDYRSLTGFQNEEYYSDTKKSWWSYFSLVGHSLPKHHKNSISTLGASSLSAFGIVGTLLEVVVYFYLVFASALGFYSLPGFKRMRPSRRDTSITGIIFNCLALQLLSSSLPVICRLLGITEFDLQGNYGRFSWLGNFYIVLAYNLVFAAVTALCLAQKVTIKIRTELYKALGLDQSRSWSSRWLTSKKESSPSTIASSTSRVSNHTVQQDNQTVLRTETKEKNVVVASKSDNNNTVSSALDDVNVKLDKLKTEVIEATKLLMESNATFIGHGKHLHDVTSTKKTEITRR